MPMAVRMPYMFHRAQQKCFEALVQHYWLTEIRPLAGHDRKAKPVPMLVKIAFSWVVGDDKTFVSDAAFVVLVKKLMLKRVGSWFHSCLLGPFPGCPDSELRRYRSEPSFRSSSDSSDRASSAVDTQSESCDPSSSVAKR